MYKNISKKTKIIIISICIFTLFVLVGITYAYFSASNVSGNSATNVITIETARHEQLILRYEENGGAINALIHLPEENKGTITTEIMKFNIENAGTVREDIAINWLEINNGFCQYVNGQTCTNDVDDTYVGDELTYTLYNCTAEEYATVTNETIASTCDPLGIADTRTPLTGDITYLSSIEKITIPENSITYYVLALNVENTIEIQNYQQNRTFSGRIYVDLYSEDRLIIEGVVYDSEGNPLPNVVVELHSDPITTTTDEKGYYRFENVPYGDHQVKITILEDTQITKSVSFVKSTNQSISEDIIRSDAKVLNVDITVEDSTLDVKFSPRVTLNVTNGTSEEERLIYLGESISTQITANEDYVLPNATINCPPGITYMYDDTGTFTLTKATVDGTCQITLPLDEKELTYNCSENGGTCEIPTSNHYITLDVDLTKQGTKAGWTFVGWNTDKDATTALATFKMPRENAILYAIYSKTNTATFNVGTGATEISSSSESCTIYNKQTECNVGAPSITTATGYTGTKFFNETNNASSGIIEGQTITLTDNKIYYGQALDIVAPAITFSSNSNATYSKTASVTVTVSDTGSLIKAGQIIKYRWQTESTCSTTASDYTLTAPLSNTSASAQSAIATAVASGLTGNHYLCIYSGIQDNALPNNNESIITKTTGTFAMDNTGPEITSIIPTVTSKTSIRVDVTGTDLGSGIDTYYYSVTTGSTCDGLTYYPSKNTNYSFTGLQEGTIYRLCVYAKDIIPNTGEKNNIIKKIPYQVTFGDTTLTYDSIGSLAYKMLSDPNVTKSTSAPTLAKTAVTQEYIDANGFALDNYVTNENGLFQTEDDNGRSYFYRGHVERNYVKFAGFIWRIVRINGDGSIRIVLNGVTSQVKKGDPANTLCTTGCAGSYVPYNTSFGYDTGTGPTNYAAERLTAIEYASYDNGNLESAINAFYETYIYNEANSIDYRDYLADSIFCSDTSIRSSGTIAYFEPFRRIQYQTSTLQGSISMRYQVANGIGKLTYPIATLSAEEVNYAGMIPLYTINQSYFLSNGVTTNAEWWTMSPGRWDSTGVVYVNIVSSNGSSGISPVKNKNGARPVVNLKADTLTTTGIGTSGDPYQVG